MIAARLARAVAAVVLVASCLVPAVPARAAGGDVALILRASGAAQRLDALPKIHTLRLHGAVKVAGIEGTADNWQDVSDGRYAQYIEAGPVGGAQGYDGANAWNRDTGGVVWDDASAQARYAALDQAYLNRYLLWTPDHGGAAVTSSGQKVVNGRRYDVLHVTPPGSLPFELWIDAVSHLPARSVVTLGTWTAVTAFSDYRPVAGLRVPFAQQTTTNGEPSTFVATRADVDEPGAGAALEHPVAHVSDFTLPSGSTTVPFQLVDNHVTLAVTIDGKGPFTFIFDTGGSNIIDAEVAKKLGLGSAGRAAGGGVGSSTEAIQFATVGALRVGDATLRKQVFAIAPIHAGFGVSSGKPIDGLIGFEVLARFVTTFDYANNRVVLRTPAASPEPAATTPFTFNGQHPMLDCTIGGFAGACVLDTGSRLSITVTSPFLAAHPSIVPAGAAAVGANGYGFGGASLGRLGRTTLQMAGFTLPDIIADLSAQRRGAFADPFYAGNVGAGVLKRFTVTFDYAHQTVALVPNPSFALRDAYDRSGTFLITQAAKIVIADVRPGTPAAQAGLERGETIATVGGRDAAALGLAAVRDAFRAAPGTPIKLRLVSKDGATRTVTLTLRDYV
ncbi:MAG: hypothetical protein JWO66_1356 [Candidatus Eremiobacteraeota bacterium]|nr:hypothetical protein [Candidatus Eremiobacteraeota bacterium]